MNPIIKIENFNGGMIDAVGLGKEPANTFQDSWNLVPTKTGSLESVHGYSTTGGLAALPTGFPVPTEGTATCDVASIKAPVYPYSSELPTAYDGRVYFVADSQGSPANHVMLDTYFKDGSRVTTPYGGFVFLDERKEFDAATTTIGLHTLTITQASAVQGLNTANNYYNTPPWVIEYWASGFSSPVYLSSMATVVGYSYNSGTDTAVITVKETINNTGLNWGVAAGTKYRLRRWFHQSLTEPNFGARPGQCFTTAGRVRGCGGPSSDVNYIPWVAQFINRYLMTGHSSTVLFKGTYVDQMDCGLNPIAKNIFSDDPWVTDAVTAANGTLTALEVARYHLMFTLEYDGYEEGRLFFSGQTVDAAASEIITYSVQFLMSCLNKRTTAINLYVAQEVSGSVTEPYFIKRFDIINPTADQLDGTYGWQWVPTTGYWEILRSSGSADNVKYQVRIDGDTWSGRGDTYYSRTGRVEEYILTGATYGPTNGISVAKHYAVWQYSENVNGRQFFADFYDPNTQTYEKDSIRYSGFDFNGSPCPDIIPYDKLFMEVDIASGDPSSVKGLIGQNSLLYIFKDSSIYSINVSPFPETWVRYTVSRSDGLYGSRSLSLLPEGEGILFGDTDHLKMIHNQTITVLTHTIANLYYGLTGKATLTVWYDKIDRAICLADETGNGYYRGYPDLAYRLPDGKTAIPWYHCLAATSVEFVSVLREGSVLFTNSTATAVYEWHKTDYTNGGANLTTYLLTNGIIPDPTSEILFSHIMLWRPIVGTSGSLDCSFFLDGGSGTGWSNQDKTKSYLFLHLPMTDIRQGKKFQFSAVGEIKTTGKIELGGIYFYGLPAKAIEQSA